MTATVKYSGVTAGMELKKYCPNCRKHQPHRETR